MKKHKALVTMVSGHKHTLEFELKDDATAAEITAHASSIIVDGSVKTSNSDILVIMSRHVETIRIVPDYSDIIR